MSGPVLVFDSGVGGLSVAAALQQRLPGAALAYICDDAMLPYGTKPEAWLVSRIVALCKAAVRESAACALVVACNTASTVALDALRSQLAVPVVGTVPAIKPAARLSRNRCLALLATSATVNRPYTQALINDFAAECRVLRLAADPLVAQAERLLTEGTLDETVVARCLAPLWEEPTLDTVVLGCTHFPLMHEALNAAAHRPVAWVDSGEAIARRVQQVVVPSPRQGPGPAWVTGNPTRLAPVFPRFGFAPPRLLDVAAPSASPWASTYGVSPY